MTMADKQTIAAYDDSIEKYLQLTDDGKPKPSLLRFIKLLPNGGNVLDLGCGPGTDAAHMAKAG